jgi:F0F1-type ATP synthase membrane subunit c/vacuolar-type H+-ATPase subunit K
MHFTRLRFIFIIKFLIFVLLFVKAAKVIALSVTFLPLMGCAVATGLVFSALIKGISYSPEQEDVLFNYTTLGFAFIESFAFMLFLVAAIILSF